MASPALTAAIETLIDEIAELVAIRVVHRMQQGTPDMVDQTRSPLGRRRHCYATRRRISEGKAGAAVVGRRHLLSREALAEELARLGLGPKHNDPKSGESVADQLRRELGLIRDAAATTRAARKTPRAPPTPRETAGRKTSR